MLIIFGSEMLFLEWYGKIVFFVELYLESVVNVLLEEEELEFI